MRVCSHCGGTSRVRETRTTTGTIRRRRECIKCGYRWWTHEVREGAYVVDHDMQAKIDGARNALQAVENDLVHLHERLRS